ncbi:MAG TPA: carboxypeptidase regulatory-like domain-containing protein [Terriglobia bacterium]|nr:carboxypeptidase regulatory-like domain-containing protein [Terriglobia bacterium]
MGRIRFPGSLIAVGFTFAYLPLATVAWGQVSGTMSGYVTDNTGASVPDAKLTATIEGRGTTFFATTNTEGFYFFTVLEPGTYSLSVEKEGFKRHLQNDLTVTVRQNLRVDVSLQLGSTNQSVTVVGGAPLVDTTSATVSGLVNDERIVDLPLNGRNVIDLAAVLPGVLNVSASPTIQYAISGPTMNVNGGRGNWNFFTLDGAYFLNGARNTGLNYPPPDAVQEFRMQTASFDAQYGFNAGSQMAVVSKTGSDSFHGDVYEFLRNTVLDTRNFFSSNVPTLIQNQFGGTAGGPIKRDKVFFFGSFQDFDELPQSVANESVVPTGPERTGDFSTASGVVLSNPTNSVTGAPLTTPTGAPCVSNNIIASSCISPVAQKLLNYIPTPGNAAGTIVAVGASPVHVYNYFGRIDVNLSPRNVLFGHFYIDRNSSIDPTAGGSLTTFMSAHYGLQTTMAVLSDTYTIKPTLINQAMVSYMRSASAEIPNKTITPTSLGMVNMPQYDAVGGISDNVTGAFTTDSTFVSANTVSSDYQFRDTLTWIHGRHTLIFGGEDLFPLSYVQHAIQQPSFYYTGTRSGNPLADFLLGSYTELQMQFGGTNQNSYTNQPDLFFQDTFKATPRLTVTMGVRWEPDLFYWDKWNHIDTFKPGAQSTVQPGAPPGILFPNDSGIPRTLAPAEWHPLAPRLGIAWDPKGNGKMSIRASYGTFFDRLNGDILAQMNAPFSGLITVYNGQDVNPFGSVGVTPPPVTPGRFDCAKTATFPGVNCPLYPLPVFGFFTEGNLREPYTEEWNFSIQRQLNANTMLEAAYIGNRGIKLNNLENFNPGRFIPGTSVNPATGVETANSSLENVNKRVLYEPGIIAPNSWELGNEWRSWYDSFQVQLNHRMSHGLSVMGSYSLAKALDMCSAFCEGCGNAANPFNLRSMKGRAQWDRRHAFVASYLWSPPVKFSDHWKNVLLGGWTFSGITTIQSGMPITFYNPVDVAVNGTTAGEHAFLTGQPIAMNHANRGAMVNEFFNTKAFVNPTCSFTVPSAPDPQVIEHENCTPDGITYSLLGQYGQSGRDILSGPAFSNTDFAVLRNFAFKERYKVEFRAESFNIFNQVNFGNPNSTVTSSTFGQLTNANPGRIIQFGLKVHW